MTSMPKRRKSYQPPSNSTPTTQPQSNAIPQITDLSNVVEVTFDDPDVYPNPAIQTAGHAGPAVNGIPTSERREESNVVRIQVDGDEEMADANLIKKVEDVEGENRPATVKEVNEVKGLVLDLAEMFQASMKMGGDSKGEESKGEESKAKNPTMKRLNTKFKGPKPMTPNNRPPEDTKLSANIRDFARTLMDRRTKKDLVPQPASDEDISLFEQGKHPGPIAQRGLFFLDLRGPITSAWNKRASIVFADAFVASGKFKYTDKDLIALKFNGHIRTICNHYDEQNGTRKQKVDLDGNIVKESQNDVLSRRNQLSFQRSVASRSFPGLEEQSAILHGVLGGDAVSDDGVDGGHDHGEKRYRIVDLRWRNQSLTRWIRTFDGLYNNYRYNDTGTATPGNWPRIRVAPHPDAPKSNRLPPTGMPINFFDPSYLKSLQRHELESLKINPVPRKLTFPSNIVSIAERFRDVTGNNITPPQDFVSGPSFPPPSNTQPPPSQKVGGEDQNPSAGPMDVIFDEGSYQLQGRKRRLEGDGEDGI